SDPGRRGAVCRLRRGPSLSAAAAADPIRRLRRLAAELADGREPGAAARLLAQTVGGGSGPAGSADGPAAAGGAAIPRRPCLLSSARRGGGRIARSGPAPGSDPLHGPPGRL